MARQRMPRVPLLVVLCTLGLLLVSTTSAAQNAAVPRAGQAPGSLAAEAGLVALPATGQTRCYNTAGAEIACTGTGQDGEVRAGTAWNAATRFVAGTGAEADCVIDTLTGLMWTKHADLAGDWVLWQAALDDANTRTVCGHADWQVPNIVQLTSLVHGGANEALCGGSPCVSLAEWLTEVGFTSVVSGPYWSSTSSPRSPIYAVTVELNEGKSSTGNKNSDTARLWPVRVSGQPGAVALPATGQRHCWDVHGDALACDGTGQDGDTRDGVAWTPSTRFAPGTGDEAACIHDTLTGLMWPANADLKNGTRSWATALSDANGLTLCGHADWRLPNDPELASLAHWGFNEETCGTTPCDANGEWLLTQGFTNTYLAADRNWRWTSTTNFADLDEARGITQFDNGRQASGKTYSLTVWPVRGGLADTRTLTVTKAGTGSGTVTPDSGSLNWVGNVGTGVYPQGTLVGLTAEAAGDSTFDGWSGDCSGDTTSTSVLLDVDRACTATFSQVTHTVAPVVVPPAGGTMTCDPNPVPHGATSSCSIVPAAGYGVQSVTGCGAGILIGLTYTTGAITADCTVTATLQARPDFVVTAITLVPPVPVPGKPVTVKATVRNQGLAAGTLGSVGAWLDRPGVPGCGEVADAARSFGPLAAGAQRVVVLRGLVAGPEGPKTAQVMADAGCGTPEADEGNNTRSLAYDVVLPKPDFVVTAIVFVPASPLNGTTFKARVTVRNQGDAAGDGGSLFVWLNRDTVPGCGEVPDATRAVGNVAKGGRKVLVVPGLAAGAAGVKTLLTFVDGACVRAEQDETNNLFGLGYTVR